MKNNLNARQIHSIAGGLKLPAGILLAAMLAVPAAFAANGNDTWTGGGADANWNTAGNWTGANTPPIAGDSLFFDGSLQLSPNNNITANTVFNGITLNTGANPFSLGGNAVNLAGGVTNFSLNAQAITLPLALTASQSFNVSVWDGSLTISSVISQTSSGFGLTKTGSGLLKLSSATSTYTGPVSVLGGTLSIDSDARLGTAPGSATVGQIVLDGGVLRNNQTGANSFTINANRGIALGDAGTGTFGGFDVPDRQASVVYNGILANNGGNDGLLMTGAGTAYLGGASTYTGNTTINYGVLYLNFNSGVASTTNILYNGVTAGGLVLGGVPTTYGDVSQGGTQQGNNNNSSQFPNATLSVNGAGTAVANSQTFGGLTLNNGANAITLAKNSATSVALTLGGITHNAGGVVFFNVPAGTSIGSTASLVNSIIGGYAVFGTGGVATDYATISGGNIAAASYTTLAGAAPAIVSGTSSNVRVSSASTGNPACAAGTTDINSLLINDNTGTRTINIGSGNILRLGSQGGIFTVNVAPIIGVSGSSAGTLTAGGAANTAGEISFIAGNNGGNAPIINSVIADNGGSSYPVTVSYSGYQAGSEASYTVNGANTYSGGTYINGGTRVNPTTATAFGTGPVTILPGGQIFPGANLTFANNIFVVGGGSGENQSFGAIRVNSGGGWSGTITLLGNTRLGSSGSQTATLSGQVTGNYDLDFNNSTFTLANTGTANNWGGNTTIGKSNGAKLILGAANQIPDGSSAGNVIIYNGSTLELNGFSETINGLVGTTTVAQGTVQNTSTGSSVLTVGGNNQSSTFNGLVTDSGIGKTLALVKTGSGTLVLGDGTNAYVGGTTINGGTVRLGQTAGTSPKTAIGANTSALTVNTGGAFDLNGFGQTVGLFSGTGGTVLNSSSTAATFTAGDSTLSATYSGTLANSGSGGLAFTKQGSGALTLNGTLSYSGLTTVGAGKLVIPSSKSGSGNITVANSAALGVTVSGVSQITPTTLTLGTSAGVTLEFNGITSTTVAPLAPVTTLSAGGTVTINVNSGTFTTGQSYPLFTFPGSAPAVALGTLTGASGNLSTNGSTIQLNVTSVAYVWSGANNGNWDLTTLNNWTAGGSPATYADGASTLFDNTASGTTSVAVNAVVQPASVTVNNNSYTITSSSGKFIGGSASLTKNGTGTLTLAGGYNTNNGVVTISGGTVSVGTLANGGAASDLGASANAAANVVVNGGTLQYTGAAANVDRLFTLGTLAVLDASGSGALNLNNSGALGYTGTAARTLTFTGSSTASNTVAAVVADNTGATTVTKSGAGTWVLGGANTFSGGVNLTGGELGLGGSGALGSSGTISFSGGTLQFSAANTTDYSARFSTAAGQAFSIDNGGQNVTLGTALTSSGGSLTALGAGTLALTALPAYSGTTTISNGVLALNYSGSQTPGTIAGNGALLLAGGGTTTLNVANTYSGGTTLNNGTLVISQVNALGTGNLTLAGGLVQSGNYLFTNTVVVTGNATYQNTGDNSDPGHPGALSGSGTLTNISAVNSFKWCGDISGFTGTFYDNSTANMLFQGTTAGSQNGSNARWVVNNTHGFALSVASPSSGTFKMGELSGTGIIYGSFNSGGVITYEVGALNTSNTFSGTINNNGSGVAALTKVGTGTLTLSGANPFTGSLLVKNGNLAVATVNNASAVGPLGNSANAVVLGDGTGTTGTLEYTGSTAASTKPFALTNGGFGAFQIDTSGQTLTLSAVVSGGGGLIKTGAGGLTLSGVNTYSGGTTVSNGTLTLSTAQTGGGALAVVSGATLGVAVSGGGSLAASTVTLGGGAINFSGVSSTANPAINGSGALTVSGPVILNVSGTLGINTYPLIHGGSLAGAGGFVLGTVPIGITAGIVTNGTTIALNVTAATPDVWTGVTSTNWDTATSGNWTFNGGATVYADGVLVQFDDSSSTTNVNLAINVAPGGMVINNTNNNYTFASANGSAIGGSTTLTKNGNGSVSLAGLANTYTGGTVLNGGSVLVSADSNLGNSAGSLLLNGAQLTVTTGYSSSRNLLLGTAGANVLNVAGSQTLTLSGSAANSGGAGALVKAGTGTLVFNTAGTFSGGTTISNGTVEVDTSGNTSQFGTGPVTNSGGTLTININGNTGNTYDYANSLVLDGGTLNNADGDVHLATGVGATINVLSATTIYREWGHGNTGKKLNFDGILEGSGGLTLNDINGGFGEGAALMITNNANTYSGTITVDSTSGNGMALIAGGNTALQHATVNVQGNGTGDVPYGLRFNPGVTTPVIGALAGNGNFLLADLASATVNLTISNNGTANYSGGISGAGSLTVEGSGTQALGGANTYSGNTTINGGTLLVNGTLGGVGVATVNNGGILAGVGGINGATTVNSGGVVAAGTNWIGVLTFSNNLTFNAASTNRFMVTTSGGASNQVAVVSGTLTPNSSSIEINTAGDPNLGVGTNVLFNYPISGISGSFTTIPVFDTAQTGAATNALIVDDGAGHIDLVVANPAVVPLLNTNAYLTSLVFSPSSGFAPAFTSNLLTGYNETNAYGDTPTVTVTNADPTATNTLIVNGVSLGILTNSVASVPLTLGVGSTNVVQVQVVSQDLSVTNLYVVDVTLLPPPPSTDASMAFLVLSPAGTLSPSFASGTTNYTANEANANSQVTVTVTNTSSFATNVLFLNGVPQATNSGALTATSLPLGVGSTNVIEVVVTAQDGVTMSTNTVTVTRLPSTNAYLTSLVLNPAGLTSTFVSNTFSYLATNAYGNSPAVTVTNADTTATNCLIYNNTTNILASGSPSSGLALTLGVTNVAQVQVTAQDGVTVQTYQVNIVEQPSQTVPHLTNSVSGSTLTLSWPLDHLGYRLLVQTNNLNKGVSGNTNDWGTVANSTTITATNIAIIKTSVTNEYYRLVYP